MGIQPHSNPNKEEYKYQASVMMNTNSYIKIDFSTFNQQGNKIIINNYCEECKIHMKDFKGYEIINKSLTIVLTDNDNEFKYKDRTTGEMFNENKFATQ